MTAPTHAPTKRQVNVAFQGKRWIIECPCGDAPTRRLDPSEVREVMQRHGGEGS